MVARVLAGAICGAGPGILFGFGASAGRVMDIKFRLEQVPATVRAFTLIGAIVWLVCVCIHAQG
jgi:hypothetical protein